MSLFLAQFRAELLKLFARRRTWIGFGLFILIEVAILFMLQREGPQRAFRRMIEGEGGMFDDYFGGLTLAFNVLCFTVFLIGALSLSLVGGDIIAKEVEDGTLRMTLCRPVSRVRLLAVKYATCVLYTFLLLLFIGTTALLAGMAWRGIGNLIAMQPEERLISLFSRNEGLVRYFLCLPAFALALLSITTTSFFFSCLNMKPAAATVLTMAYFLVDYIFRHIPYFADYQNWFITTHTVTWLNCFRSPVPAAQMVEDYGFLLAVNFTLLIIGGTVFCTRDFKS